MSRATFHPGLEGLRGVSLIGVLAFHASPHVPGGFLGVSTFFTLSGFLITGLLLREWEARRNIDLLAFWGRRVRRLLPASLITLAAIAILGPGLADATQIARLTGDGWSALLYFSNWWLIATGAEYESAMGSASPIQHFWSLSIEEQYYFIYPIACLALFRACSGSKNALLATFLVATSCSWTWMAWLSSTDASTARLYYGTDTRVAELMLGGALALVHPARNAQDGAVKKGAISAVGLTGLAVTVCAWFVASIESNALYQGGLILYALSSAAILFSAAFDVGALHAVLGAKPFRWLGRISYGAYVYHWPIFLWIDDGAAGVALTLAFAHASHRYVEEPIRRGRWPATSRPLAIAVFATVIVATALWFAGPASNSDSGTLHRIAAHLTPPSQPLKIAVAGDSFAHDVGVGLAVWAKQTGKAQVFNMARRGCGIARGAWLDPDNRSHHGCDRFFSRVQTPLEQFEPDVVVIVTTSWDLQTRRLPEWSRAQTIGEPDFDAWLIDQYRETIDFMNARGARVVWLTTPCFGHSPGARTEPPNPAHVRRMNDFILPTLTREEGRTISIVDIEAAICPSGRVETTLYGIDDFRPDGLHFSDAGKRWVGEWLGEQLLD